MKTREDIERLFAEAKQEIRDAGIELPANINEEIKINGRPRKRYGCCKKKNDEFFIEISEFILAAPAGKIKEVMIHELLHTCEECYNHGREWKRRATRMNDKYGYLIKRTLSMKEMGLSRGSKR